MTGVTGVLAVRKAAHPTKITAVEKVKSDLDIILYIIFILEERYPI
jgi:hypothetical protein